jgi:hypothetical protein
MLKLDFLKPGNPRQGILDFGIVSGEKDLSFEGFIALIRKSENPPPEIVLDSGTLKLSDGRVLKGEFTQTYQERYKIQNLPFKVGAEYNWSGEPYLFYGTISKEREEIQGPLFAAEKLFREARLLEAPSSNYQAARWKNAIV